MESHANPERILVIKLGSLGDFAQAFGPMEAIRKHHKDADITLLTTAPYVSLGRACGYFNHILTDTRPRWTDIKGWSALFGKLNKGGFTRVYDLQNSDRSNIYFHLFVHKPEWVGTARGASHRNASPQRIAGSPFAGHKQTLKLAGIETVRIDPMDWVKGDVASLGLKDKPYVLIVPGCSPHLPQKKWPAERYGAVAARLFSLGYLPVIIGTMLETDAAVAIRTICPESLDLTGQTTLTDIILLGRHATAAIGGDTGPMHLIGPTGCPGMVLFSSHSDPARHAPLGPGVETVQSANLNDLSAETVIARLNVRGFRHMGDSIVFTARHEH